ncbi:MAG: hypothetical protein RLZZ188_1777 [Verrucomicrobiota bacterium]|jgi:hypothetical protein
MMRRLNRREVVVHPVSASTNPRLIQVLRRPSVGLALLAAFLVPAVPLQAQWKTETYSMIAGWNAIWLPLEPAVANIDSSLSSRPEIIEVWRWNPPSGPQFVTDPSTPVQTDPAWSVWRRGAPGQSTLFSFTPNSAYLIRVADGSTTFTLSLQGRPVIPNYRWSTTGVNFVGFPTASPGPTFAQFLPLSSALADTTNVLKYVGGPLISSGTSDPNYISGGSTIPNSARNPQLVNLPTERVSRGVAYWVQATKYSDYYGPISVGLTDQRGLNFGRTGLVLKLNLRNKTAAQAVTVSLSLLASDNPPSVTAGTALMGTDSATAGMVVGINPDINNSLVFATPPTVTISAPSAGTRATATATLSSGGTISGFVITNRGAGYGATTPTVTVTPTISGNVPLKVRGGLNSSGTDFDYSSLTVGSAAQTVTLPAGQSADVVIVVDRVAMGGTPGQLFAGLLRVTDSLGQTSFDLPVSAVASDLNGLWSGVAVVSDVSQISGSQQVVPTMAAATATISSGKVTGLIFTNPGSHYITSSKVTITGGGGSGATATVVAGADGYLQQLTVTNQGSGYTSAPTVTFDAPTGRPGKVAASMSVPLLLHRDASGVSRLVQQVFVVSQTSSVLLASAENLLPSGVKPTGRMSVVSLPAGTIRTASSGSIGRSGSVVFEVLLDYNSDSNPFVHRFHPDHDNLDARFETALPVGRESLTVKRTVTFQFVSSVAGISDPAWGSTMLGGTYTEVVEGLRSVPITISGNFLINRVSDTASLLIP